MNIKATLDGFREKCSKEQKKLNKKYPYYPIEYYFERIDEVCGMEHVNISLLEEGLFALNSGQEAYRVRVKVSLLDDDFKEVIYREATGIQEVQYTDQGIYAGLKNISTIAEQKAIKNALHLFGFFGKFDEESSSSKEKEPKKTEVKESKPQKGYVLKTSSEMTEERTDKNTGKPVYSVFAEDLKGLTKYKIVFYPNKYLENTEKMNTLIASSKQGVGIKIEASECNNEGVLIFNKFN